MFNVGSIVFYCLTADNAEAINRRREHAKSNMDQHGENSSGVQVHVGNSVKEGDVFPMLITKMLGSSPTCSVNGQVSPDGNDLLWVTSVERGDGPGHFSQFAPN